MYDFSSFDHFVLSTRNLRIGNGECWDYINLIWSHDGSRYWTYPPSDPSATNHGVKWGVLNAEAKAANTRENIAFIANLSDVKRGDIVVISDGTYGHAGFANEVYNGSGRIHVYSQNYAGRRTVDLDNMSISTFIGAFRYIPWSGPIPPTPTITGKSKFPWVLYARKLREQR